MDYSVYKLTAPNGKVYIGITSRDPKRRWNAGNGYKYNKHFYDAIQKYGWENIKKEVLLSGVSQEEAYRLEKELILKHRSSEREYGYNKSFGGESTVKGLHWRVPKESVERRAAKMRGRKLTEEHRKKLSDSHKGQIPYKREFPTSEETRLKISNSLKKWYAEHESPAKGKTRKRAQWEIEKVSRGHYKPVVCIETGIIYESIMAAEMLTKTDGSSISAVCKGKRKTAGGFHWRYEKDV
jgi:predicted GIY-YIG superfamily endonuclease